MGCHFLLQGIFPTEGSNPGLPHCRQKLFFLTSAPPGKPFESESVQLFVTPWTVACQASSVHGILQARILNGLPFPSPGALPKPGIELASPVLVGGFFTAESPGKLVASPLKLFQQHKLGICTSQNRVSCSCHEHLRCSKPRAVRKAPVARALSET